MKQDACEVLQVASVSGNPGVVGGYTVTTTEGVLSENSV